jgi:hypothetical protein
MAYERAILRQRRFLSRRPARRIACHDDALAALDGTNVERWHQQCRCTILRCDYSPSLTAIVYDPVIKIIDRDATRRVVACLANIHAIYLESDRDDRLSSG